MFFLLNPRKIKLFAGGSTATKFSGERLEICIGPFLEPMGVQFGLHFFQFGQQEPKGPEIASEPFGVLPNWG